MKNVKFLMLFLVASLIYSCGDNSETVDPNSLLNNDADKPLFSEGESEDNELIEIGYVEGEEFFFSLTEDQLHEIYATNIENNFGEAGTYDSGALVASDEESEEQQYFVLLEGSLGDEGSATISSDVTLEYNDEGTYARVLVNVRPVLPGICYNINCNQCKKSDLTPTNLNCRCQSNFTLTCPYYIDPHVVWYF